MRKKLSKDALERSKFISALLEFVKIKGNYGFELHDFFNYLDSINLPAKSRKKTGDGTWIPDRHNDFVTTAQKAAQDWCIIIFYYHKVYYIDDRSAKYLKLNGKKPLNATIYSGSKRGFTRRVNTKRILTIVDLVHSNTIQDSNLSFDIPLYINYSISDFISKTDSQSTFYLMTNILKKEGFIQDISWDSLKDITKKKLKEYHLELKHLYNSPVELMDQIDSNGFHIKDYFNTLNDAFLYTLQLTSLEVYWKTCLDLSK